MNKEEIKDKIEVIGIELRGFCDTALLIMESTTGELEDLAEHEQIKHAGKLNEYMGSLDFLLSQIGDQIEKLQSCVDEMQKA